MHDIKPIALYLPQFHPIAENDLNWEPGFTEWYNVVKGKPLFPGHYQPHLPSDFGFYDLRVADVIVKQVQLARESNIYGFCFYHYWFQSNVLLNSPIQLFKSLDLAFPFCLCWANENWTRRWDGNQSQVLLEQSYCDDDYLQHIEYLCKNYFSHSDYIKVNGSPLIIIYKQHLIPNISHFVNVWRRYAKEFGFPDLYFVFFQLDNSIVDPDTIGFNFGAQFAPFTNVGMRPLNFYFRLLNKYLNFNFSVVIRHNLYSYVKTAKRFSSQYNVISDRNYPCVMPMFDNSVRRIRGGAEIFVNSNPSYFRQWIKEVLFNYKKSNSDSNFFFINAWNEWAEGNHLEPDQKWGKQFLDVVKECFNNYE